MPLLQWNSSNSEWQIIRSETNSELSLMLEGGFDPLNDLVVPSDYDGDGKPMPHCSGASCTMSITQAKCGSPLLTCRILLART